MAICSGSTHMNTYSCDPFIQDYMLEKKVFNLFCSLVIISFNIFKVSLIIRIELLHSLVKASKIMKIVSYFQLLLWSVTLLILFCSVPVLLVSFSTLIHLFWFTIHMCITYTGFENWFSGRFAHVFWLVSHSFGIYPQMNQNKSFWNSLTCTLYSLLHTTYICVWM